MEKLPRRHQGETSPPWFWGLHPAAVRDDRVHSTADTAIGLLFSRKASVAAPPAPFVPDVMNEFSGTRHGVPDPAQYTHSIIDREPLTGHGIDRGASWSVFL
jgi:hypothetical protein